MPAGPRGQYDERAATHLHHYNPAAAAAAATAANNNNNDAADLNGDESAASILQSVKEQEAQFEQLTRELEAERQSVATQLERCKLGSETASMSSISSTDESFHWRQPVPQHEPAAAAAAAAGLHHADEESDAESKMSGSQLVDSCLRFESHHYHHHHQRYLTPSTSSRRVLQERGLMNVGEDPLEYIHDDSGAPPPRPPPSSEHYTSYSPAPAQLSGLSNGPTSLHDTGRGHSPNPSLQSSGSRTGGGPQHYQVSHALTSPPPHYHADSPDYQSYSSLHAAGPVPYSSVGGSSSHLLPPAAAAGAGQPGPPGPPPPPPRPYSPAASSQGRATPTRFTSPPQSEPRFGSRLVDGGPYGGYHQGAPRYDPYDAHPGDYTPRDASYDQYPGPGGDHRPSPGPQPPYLSSPYDRPPYDDVSGEGADMYRSTPPPPPPDATSDSYRRLPNGGYAAMSAADRYRNTPPIDGGAADPYRDIPAIDDDRFDPTRPPSERGDGYLPREDDQYGDARPTVGEPTTDRYGRALVDDGRQRQTPSPAPGSDRPGTFGYDHPHQQQQEEENPYGSRSMMPYGQEGPGGGHFDDSGLRHPYENPAPTGLAYRDDGLPLSRDIGGAPPRAYENLGDPNLYNTDDGPPARNMYDDGEEERLPYSSPQRGGLFDDGPHLQGAPPDEFDPNRRSPSIDSETRDQRWRNPDLPEVIDFLSHSSNAIKANAAAYLQHLCYMDDGVKAKTRGLGGIPALVELVNNEIPEVHRAACGALRNLSFGRANDENKRAIKNASGIPALVRLLRKSPDNDVRELVTGILWNLSSCQDIKKQIIDDGLTVIVNNVIIPHSGWDRNLDVEALRQPRDVYWSTVFRNASGILRNISSDAEYARKKLRECEGLVDAIFYIVRAAIGKNDIDNKSVENCVCVLRNLSYACQEVEDPAYLKRRNQPKPPPSKGETTGCFGGNKKKKDPQKIDQRGRSDSGYQSGRHFPSSSKPRSEPVRGMELLWQPDVVSIYLPLLSDCSNPETLEAAAGAIQNLAACDWQPSSDIRAAVRKERGLPIIVELLTVEADRVVCAAATALRNLALDHRNKELIGKYAMRQLVMKLPQENRQPDFPVSDDTITAVQATLYEVVKKNADFAQSLLNEDGVERLVHITKSRGKYSSKVVKFASSILYTMWQFRELHQEYKARGWKEQHFVTRTMAASNKRGGPSTSANNTLNRPRMDLGGGHPPSSATQSEPSSPGSHQRYANSVPPGSYSEPAHTPDSVRGMRGDDRLRPEDIPMQQMGSAGDMPSPGYASIDNQRAARDDHRPPGGVPLFPNLPPGGQQPQPQVGVDARGEPLYAQVNKTAKRRPDGGVMLDGRAADGGTDSWV